ncbi:hypothetical protein ASG43_05350 [Aureimonas sp. Leaf454]|nr:hypothetical protein ASG43_05350 [Aureimonas sp. Leaf454]
MMDGEEVYRARLAACLAAAEASSLPQVRARHRDAARSWQALLDAVLLLKSGVPVISAPETDVEPVATRPAD